MKRQFVVLVALSGALSLFGCGGPMQPEELARSIETLESTAAEGALLADHVAHDRSKSTFVRAHARELGETVEHEAEKLNDADAEAEPQGAVAPAKDRAIDLADEISAALGRIQTAPDDEAEGGVAEKELSALSEKAGRLAEGL